MEHTKKEPINALLWRSLDMRVIRRDTITMGTLVIAVTILLTLLLRTEMSFTDALLDMMPFCGLLMTLVVLGWIFQTRLIFRKAEEYQLFQVVLENPSITSSGAVFPLKLEHPDGTSTVVVTRRIFRGWRCEEPTLDSYLNKTVTVAWNPKTDRVVVIG